MSEPATPPPQLDRSTDGRVVEFGAALGALTRLGQLLDRNLRDAVGISQGSFEALLRIERSGGFMAMGTLADQILFTSGGVTRLVDRLTAEGLAERRPCPTDRRIQYVAITDAGRRKLRDALDVHVEDLEREYFGRMSDHERRVLADVLGRLRASDQACS